MSDIEKKAKDLMNKAGDTAKDLTKKVTGDDGLAEKAYDTIDGAKDAVSEKAGSIAEDLKGKFSKK